MTDTETKQQLRAVIEEVEALDLPDGAHWALIHERMGWEYGTAFEWVSEDPEFYGYEMMQ